MATIDEQFIAQSLRFAQEFNTLRANEMGARGDLLTTNKTTLVAAINEIYNILGGSAPAPGSVIDDGMIGPTTTWSSTKLNQMFNTAGAGVIDDAQISISKTWSSSKIDSETDNKIAMAIATLPSNIDDSTTDLMHSWSGSKITAEIAASGGAVIDDSVVATTSAWSSAKTNNAINAALAGVPAYVLPTASATVLGGIKIGSQFSLDGQGRLVSNMTGADVGLPNVENKSSSTIRGEITNANVVAALGYVPAASGASVLIVKDEGAQISAAAKSFNFVGAKVSAATDGNDNITITVADTTKADVGLANAENKSSATIRGEITAANVTGALGYTPVNPTAVGLTITPLVSGLVPAQYLPTHVDEIQEYPTVAAFPATGQSGVIYIVTSGVDIDKQYRWATTAYHQMVQSPGTTDNVAEGVTNKYFTENRVLATLLAGISFVTSTAVTAADSVLVGMGKLQAQATALGARITALTKADVGLGNVDNVSAATIQGGITSANVTNALTYTPSVQITAKDEGTLLTGAMNTVNFVGAGVSAAQASGVVTVTIPGSAIANTDALPEGVVNVYYTDARTRAAVLTGLSVATGTAVVATDSVLVAVGKLQAQATTAAAGITAAKVQVLDEGVSLTAQLTSINFVGANVAASNVGGAVTVTISSSTISSTDALAEGTTNLYFTAARAIGSALTGLSTATNAAITAADTVLTGMGKLQRQITDFIGQKAASNGLVSMNLFKINLPNDANTFTSTMNNVNTAIRAYLWPDKSGTVAMLSDIVSPAAPNNFTATQTFSGSATTFGMNVLSASEKANIIAAAATGTLIMYIGTNGAIAHYTVAASAAFALNVGFTAGNTMNTAMAVGDMTTVMLIVTQGATPYSFSALQIDGNAQTIQWLNKTVPSIAPATSKDTYTFTIEKTAAGVFAVYGSQAIYG